MTRPRPTDEVAADVGSTPGLGAITNEGPADWAAPARHAAVEDLTAPTVVSAVRPAAPDDPGEAQARASEVRVGELVGRHLVLGELGRGGMGRVFLARDRELDRLVAIKFVTVVDATRIERFLAEARVTARCTHPNIVAVHEIGQHHDAPYLVLEHIAGESLAQLARRERLSVPRVLTIMTAVARALACAHSHGIVHRDLKPTNVVVRTDDTVKVLDFGIAAYAQGALDDEPPTARRPPAARRGEVAGTLRYMAPEQLGGEALDGRADLWAFGVMLFELLAGARPYDHLDDAGVRAELADPERPTPSIAPHRADVPPGLARVIDRCLEKRRARRYRSADELVAALQRLAGDRAACELPLWLTLAPTADEADRVAVGLVRALATRGLGRGLDPARLRVWPDGRVEVTATDALTSMDAPAPNDDLRAIATLASQAIESVGGPRTATERRRAQRMNRVLAQALRPSPTGGLTTPRLARRLAAAHSPRTPRVALAGLVLVALAGVTARLTILRPAATTASIAAAPASAQRLERLEREMARLRATGDQGAATALFDRFVAQPESAAMHAEAWLRRAERERSAGALEPALDSAAAAYQAAPDEPTAARALGAVIAVQLARRRWDELAQALAARGPRRDPADRAAIEALALATRRPPPSGPMTAVGAAAAHLLRGQPTLGQARAAATVDLDGDGQPEVIAHYDDAFWATRPGEPELWRMNVPRSGPRSCAWRDRRGAWFASTGSAITRLFRVDAHGATPVHQLAIGIRCAFGDLDGDGEAELYVGGPRALVRLRADATGAWQATEVPLGSVVNALATGDLDGDGRDELAVAAGEWQAYDVRVLTGPTLTMVDRIRLGRVSALTTLRQGPGRPRVLVARKDRNWPSALFLPAGRPSGAPDGYYALRLDGGRLGVVGHLGDRLTSLDGEFEAADLDGDGRDEGLAIDRTTNAGIHRTMVVHFDGARLTSATLESVAVLATGRFAAGPTTGALATVSVDGRPELWWLGFGATPLPPLAATPAAVTTAVPADLEPPLALAWRRAITLGRVGATAGAIAAFRELAVVVPPEVQSAALTEVLALRKGRGEPLWPIHQELAARAAPGSPAALAATLAAVDDAIAEGEFEVAVRLIDEAAARPALDAGTRDQLTAARARAATETTTLFDGATLDEPWDIRDPLAIRRDPVTRTLVLDGFGAQPIAALELTRGRGPVQLDLEATITRAEWGAGMRFALQPDAGGGMPVAFTIESIGGGGVYRLIATLDTHGTYIELGPHRGVDAPIALKARVTWFPDAKRLVSDFTVNGVRSRRVVRRGGVATEAWRLEIDSASKIGEGSPTRLALALTRLSVSGFAPIPRAPTTPSAQARLALANGEVERVRALAPRLTGRDAAMVAAALALRVRDRAGALAGLRRWLGPAGADPDALRVLAHLVRVEDSGHAEVALDAAGSAQIAVVAAAWAGVARQHPDAELVQRELTQNLRHLELRATSPDAAALLLLRARAYARIGELADARADLDALLAPSLRDDMPLTWLAEAFLERARVAVQVGDRAAAGRAILDALDVSPWPDAVADAVLLDPMLVALADAPGLERVRALGRTLFLP